MPTGEPWTACWWTPPAEQRLCASSPPKREPLTNPWPGPRRTAMNGWPRRIWQGKKRLPRGNPVGLRYVCESPLAVPCESWEGLARFLAPADNMNPVYTDVKGRSTRYCALKIGQAQDIDILPRIARLFLNALFFIAAHRPPAEVAG